MAHRPKQLYSEGQKKRSEVDTMSKVELKGKRCGKVRNGNKVQMQTVQQVDDEQE
jgi:hypothetical protein